MRKKIKNKINMGSIKVFSNDRKSLYKDLYSIIEKLSNDEIVLITLDFLYDEIKGIKDNFDFIDTFVKEWIDLEEGRYSDYILDVVTNENENIEFISIAVMESI